MRTLAQREATLAEIRAVLRQKITMDPDFKADDIANAILLTVEKIEELAGPGSAAMPADDLSDTTTRLRLLCLDRAIREELVKAAAAFEEYVGRERVSPASPEESPS